MDHEILNYTFVVQHSPNCPSPWLVRMHGKSAVIDMKPYLGFGLKKEELTEDALGFGKTFEEAADKALAAHKAAKEDFIAGMCAKARA